MQRYAIFFVPAADTALWKFGCAAIGYDGLAGAEVSLPEHAFYTRPEIRDWTADPRRYGFHATLKPPFELAGSCSIEELETAVSDFAAARQRFSVDRFVVRQIGSFLALVPSVPSESLNQLEADCVRNFDAFRAPLTEADRARRLHSSLSETQIKYLDRWGYPYVFEEFRFHMTLTGRLPDDAQAIGLQALVELYLPIAKPVDVDALTICEQAGRGSQFVVRRRFEFAG